MHHPSSAVNRFPALHRRPFRQAGRIATLLLVCILTGLCVMLVTVLLGPQPAALHPWVSQPIPSVELTPLLNAEEPLNPADLTGKVSVINFWGPWCQPCLMEFPSLLKLRENFEEDERFQFVSVASDGQFTPGRPGFQENGQYLTEESQLILAQYNSDLPIYTDQTGAMREALIQTADFTGYPTTILVGTDGKIAAVWLGYSPRLESELSKMIRQQLSGEAKSEG